MNHHSWSWLNRNLATGLKCHVFETRTKLEKRTQIGSTLLGSVINQDENGFPPSDIDRFWRHLLDCMNWSGKSLGQTHSARALSS